MVFSQLYTMQKRLQERADKFPSDSFRITYTEEPKPEGTKRDAHGTFTEETLLSRFTEKSKEEIIRSGTAREMAALRLADFEAGQILGLRDILSDAEAEELIGRAKARRDYEEYLYYLSEFETLTQYEKELRTLYSTTQTEEAELVMLVNEWRDLQTQADLLSLLLEATSAFKSLSAKKREAFLQETFAVYPKNHTPNPEGVDVVINTEGAEFLFYFDKEEDRVKVNIEGEGRLYGRILYRAERVRGFLSTLKAAVNAVADYIDRNGGNDLLTPFGLESILREVWCESYLKLIVPDTRFLRSEIIKRQARGEEISEEEVKEAVIPDYYETEESAEARKIYNRSIARFAKKIKGTE